MLHPVGPHSAAVYWRRRLMLLLILLAVIAGLVAGAIVLIDRSAGANAEPAPAVERTELPALDRVVPSVAGVRTPEEEPSDPVPVISDPPRPVQATGGPCADDVLELTVGTPGAVAVGSKPTFELVVRNAADVPCVRALDKELQELVLVDAAGGRVWGSNDCFPESSDELRTLAPGETVAVPIVWGGLTSEPSCTAQRVPPGPGSYALRGRLDTKVSADIPLTLQ